MIGLNISKAKEKLYSDRAENGSFLIMVIGTSTKIARAKAIMDKHGAKELNIYDIASTGAATIDSVM